VKNDPAGLLYRKTGLPSSSKRNYKKLAHETRPHRFVPACWRASATSARGAFDTSNSPRAQGMRSAAEYAAGAAFC
jgi:hypothetical protein